MRHDKLQRIIEDKGFYFKHEKEKDGRYSALLEQSTPLGEDWCLEFIYKNIAEFGKGGSCRKRFPRRAPI